jgi:hypothetical protein
MAITPHLLGAGYLKRRQDRVPSVGWDLLIGPGVAHHIHRIEAVLHPLDLLAQQMPQHRDPGVGPSKVFEGMHGDCPLALLRFEIVGLPLAIFVFPGQHGTWSYVLNRVGTGSPVFFRHTVFERPGDDAQPCHMLVVYRNRPGEFGAKLLSLRHRAGLADVRNDESIRDNAFRVALETIAVRQVFDEVVTNSQRGLLKLDLWCTLHQRSLELVAADHLVQHQQMPRIDDVLVMPAANCGFLTKAVGIISQTRVPTQNDIAAVTRNR